MLQFSTDKHEKEILNALLECIDDYTGAEKPHQAGTVQVLGDSNYYNVDLYWRKKKIMLFCAESSEEYEMVAKLQNKEGRKIKTTKDTSIKKLDTIYTPEEPQALSDKVVSINVTEEVPIVDVIMELSRMSGTDIQIDPTIIGGVKIADRIAVGAGSVVTKSFKKENVTIAGNPAHIILNSLGSNSWEGRRNKYSGI